MAEVTSRSFLERIDEVEERLAALPRVRLAHLPTPLDPCPNLTRALSGPEILVKRDDCTGLAFGGNKTRQLEYILGHALADGADCVIQGAGSQSNHARQLAAAGARLGIDVYLTLKQDARSQPVQGNYLVDHLLGARIRRVPADSDMSETKNRLAEELRAQGKNPFIVGMGATRTLVLAAVAYVGCFLEIARQTLAAGERLPDWIYTTSQGGTQAGLQLGALLIGAPTRVVGINPMDAREEAYIPVSDIAELIREAAAVLGHPSLEVDASGVSNSTDYVGQYGVVSLAGLEAMHLLAHHEGILTDPVYSGKGLAGFFDHIRQGRLRTGEKAVFMHTGGLPALFAYAAEIVDSEGRTK